MGRAEQNRDRECAAEAWLTFNRDVTAEQLDQLLDKSKSDAAAFERAPLRTFDAAKPLEQVRNFIRRNSGAGVGDGKLRRRAVGQRLHPNRDLSSKRELEGIRHEVENDFF